jgi:hypothetical protein
LIIDRARTADTVIRIFCSWRIEEQAENARQMSQRARQTVSRVSHDHGLFSSDVD